MPRTIRSIRTPAPLASYSSSIRRRSASPFIFAMIRAGRPARAWLASRRIRSTSPSRRSLGRQQEVVEAVRARVAGQQVEQLGQVLAERLAAREEPEVLVDAARPDVVVAGGEMAVAPDAVGLLAHDEARLAVGLEAGDAVDDVRAHFFERARPADVRLLVEARLQLHEDGDLLAVLDGRPQRVRDGRGRAHAVERHLDGEHLGIDGGLAHEARDGVERVVRVVHEDVPRADRAPDIGRALEGGDGVRRQRPVLEPRHVRPPRRAGTDPRRP